MNLTRNIVWQEPELPCIGLVLGRLESGAVVLVVAFGRRELSIRLTKGTK